MLQIIICCWLIGDATYMPLPVSYTMITGMQELQAELSQEDLGASPLPDHPTVVLLPAFHTPTSCHQGPAGPVFGLQQLWRALTHNSGCMLPKLWHTSWSTCAAVMSPLTWLLPRTVWFCPSSLQITLFITDQIQTELNILILGIGWGSQISRLNLDTSEAVSKPGMRSV